MELGLGLNTNSFLGNQGKINLGGKNSSQTKSEGQANSFESEMKATDFSGKPIPASPTPGGVASGPGLMNSQGVDRILPQPPEKVTKAQITAEQGVDGLSRRVAWQRFLHQMKDELGVSAEDVLQSFQSLSVEELKAPPEENVDKLVSQLDLNPEQSQIARRLFQDLLQKTGSKPLAQELKASTKDINLTVMSQREQEQKKISDALQKMNEKFFMKDSQPVKAKNSNESNEKLSALAALTQMGSEVAKPSVVASAPVAAAAPMAAAVPAASPAPIAAPSVSQKPTLETLKSGEEVSPELLAEMTAVNQEEALQFSEQMTDPLAQATKVSPQVKVIETEVPEKIFTKTTLLESSAQPSGPEALLFSNADRESDFEGQGEAFDPYSSSMPVEELGRGTIDRTTFTQALGGVELAPTLGEAVSSEELVQQAQIMVREGGGEVKVILQPEGMGEVAMKVNVNGDQVSIEMITESDAAKKMLEKSMGDLKNHLQASQLNLESLKVDTASDLGQQLERQYEDAQRGQAQQFMEQFRQGNQQARRDFFEMPGVRLYQGQNKAKAPAPEASQGQKSAQGRRLNLVA